MMNKREEFLIFSAESTQMVIKAEKILKENNVECRVIPLPSEISASCGLCIRTGFENFKTMEAIFGIHGIEMDCYRVEKIGFKKKVDKC